LQFFSLAVRAGFVHREWNVMDLGWRKGVETIGRSVLRIDPLRRSLMRAAADRGRTLILAYHRIRPDGARPEDIPPTITTDRFRRQLEILGAAGDIVPLSHLLANPHSAGNLRFAITFDDDDFNHMEHALPVLNALDIKATFFLSGRSLHGLGGYWWEGLEQAIRGNGLERVTNLLGVTAESPRDLARLCEGTSLSERVSELFPITDDHPRLGAHGIRTLANAGMEIGFHTLYHPVLSLLPQSEVDVALTSGRSQLAEAAGTSVDTFAYPHGRASPAVARRVEAAGYRAAVTNLSFVFKPASDPFLLGRWDPRSVDDDAFPRSLALRLNRPASGPQRSS
jgi:peptidoglycan/xylan/chitin deacetylase (PgdA/CDA1 family)